MIWIHSTPRMTRCNGGDDSPNRAELFDSTKNPGAHTCATSGFALRATEAQVPRSVTCGHHRCSSRIDTRYRPTASPCLVSPAKLPSAWNAVGFSRNRRSHSVSAFTIRTRPGHSFLRLSAFDLHVVAICSAKCITRHRRPNRSPRRAFPLLHERLDRQFSTAEMPKAFRRCVCRHVRDRTRYRSTASDTTV